jgi:hypothetical protein
MAFAQFHIAGVKNGVHCFGQSYVGSIVDGETVTQFPNPGQQRCMCIVFSGKHRKVCEQLFRAKRINTAASDQLAKSARYFYVKQMRNNERVATLRQIASERIG